MRDTGDALLATPAIGIVSGVSELVDEHDDGQAHQLVWIAQTEVQKGRGLVPDIEEPLSPEAVWSGQAISLNEP